jgi:hypothetical protein
MVINIQQLLQMLCQILEVYYLMEIVFLIETMLNLLKNYLVVVHGLFDEMMHQ